MSFDVRDFARTAQGSLRARFDLDGVAAETPGETRRVLAALAALEGATMAHLRNVLVTPTHKDARVTAFLVTWAYEKFWIADALGAIAGGPAETVRRRERGPVRRAVRGFFDGADIVGAHMAIGLADSRMLSSAYVDLVLGEPELADVLDTVGTIKHRHEAFFAEESERRFSASPRSRRLAVRELARTPLPLGFRSLRPDDRRRIEHHLHPASIAVG